MRICHIHCYLIIKTWLEQQIQDQSVQVTLVEENVCFVFCSLGQNIWVAQVGLDELEGHCLSFYLKDKRVIKTNMCFPILIVMWRNSVSTQYFLGCISSIRVCLSQSRIQLKIKGLKKKKNVDPVYSKSWGLKMRWHSAV